jgi:DNA-binding winged helix-turn-helix (wHTH) protein
LHDVKLVAQKQKRVYAAPSEVRLSHRIRPFWVRSDFPDAQKEGHSHSAELLERPGELVSRTELQKLLWNNASYGNFEQGLNSVVNVLRGALSDRADHPNYIETVPGEGYRFIAPVRSVDAEGPNLDSSNESLPLATNEGSESEAIAEPRVSPLPQKTVRFRWWLVAGLLVTICAALLWLRFRPAPQVLLDGSTLPSSSRDGDDQFNLAFHFLTAQGDIPLALEASEKAIALNPNFSPAHLLHARLCAIAIFAGYTNDVKLLLRAEEEVIKWKEKVRDTDGLLLQAEAAVYLALGRLDKIPMQRLDEFSRHGGDPTWLAILRLIAGRTTDAMELLQLGLERRPLDNPSRMFLGEILRTKGDTTGAIHLLERTLQQGSRHMTPAFYLTLAYLDAGRVDSARKLLLRMRPEFEKNFLWRHAWAILLAVEGNHEQASAFMDNETLKFARFAWTAWSPTADYYSLQGDKDKALEWLQFAVSRGDERASYFRRNPRLSSLRGDDRFQLLLHTVELRQRASESVQK